MKTKPSAPCKISAVDPSPDGRQSEVSCPLPSPPDFSDITVVVLHPPSHAVDYLEAMRLANSEAAARLNDYMLLSWYDRDRDFEAPQHVSECHEASAIPGYVDYGIHHGATLKVDVENGRFVFFYRAVDI
jgi:hypothetical protein